MNPVSSNFQNVSPRELEILQLLAKGMQSKEIASVLFLSKHTIDTHRRNLLRKTNTKNTLELVLRCTKAGIV